MAARSWARGRGSDTLSSKTPSSGPGQMRQQAAMVRPDLVVVTAIAGDHWRSLSTLDITRNEKAEMVRALKPSGVAILNADDPNVRWMATQTNGARRAHR